ARAPENSSAPTKLGQAGVGTSASSPGPTMSRVAISIACMPPMVTKKSAGERGLGRLADERRRRQVALADPERNEALPVAAIVEHLDDAARLNVAHYGADQVGPVGGSWGRGEVHVRPHGPAMGHAQASAAAHSWTPPRARSSRIGQSGRSSPWQAAARPRRVFA